MYIQCLLLCMIYELFVNNNVMNDCMYEWMYVWELTPKEFLFLKLIKYILSYLYSKQTIYYIIQYRYIWFIIQYIIKDHATTSITSSNKKHQWVFLCYIKVQHLAQLNLLSFVPYDELIIKKKSSLFPVAIFIAHINSRGGLGSFFPFRIYLTFLGLCF